MTDTGQRSDPAVVVWIIFVMIMIYCMILVGGLTRLTGSGLSMVDWRPIMGTLPPLTDIQWEQTFEAYKQFPEYQKVNHGMSLSEFKQIFYWEYGHRVLGRSIGLVFFVPFAYFFVRRRLTGSLKVKLGFAFVLGGLQGLLGWYMVQSGLVDQPRVSHYRLAAHLGLALFLLGYLFWILLNVLGVYPSSRSTRSIAWLSKGVLGCVLVQIFYGALTAGLDAGLVYNSFPDWHGRLLPTGMMQLQPLVQNFFDNPVTVQWVHRTLAFFLVGLIASYVLAVFRQTDSRSIKIGAISLFIGLLLQFIFGVATLLWHVPVAMASLHQAGAVVVMLLALWNVYMSRTPSAHR
jgi:cytochrome c oxidase assembly protein subunit 15